MKTTTFEARYGGRCGNCGSDISVGDWVFYDQETGKLIRVECCVDDIPVESTRATSDEPIKLSSVMPRGKTKADMCTSCFIIHSPGQVNCE